MYGDEMRELDAGTWADLSYLACPCRRGWLLSDFDTYHRCPVHGEAVPHPEDEDGCDRFDWAAYTLRMLRLDWRRAQERSGLDRETFHKHIKAVGNQTRTPTDWVKAAWAVSDELWQMNADIRAQAMGYSCRLEAAWATEGALEREARAAHVDPDVFAPRGSPLRRDLDSWYRNP